VHGRHKQKQTEREKEKKPKANDVFVVVGEKYIITMVNRVVSLVENKKGRALLFSPLAPFCVCIKSLPAALRCRQ